MTQSTLNPVTHDGFSLIPKCPPDRLEVEFTGNGDIEAVDPLKAFLRQLQEEIGRLGKNHIRFDFRELTFLNSSCFKAFVTFLVTLAREPKELRVEFLSNPNLHWQKRSLFALQQLAPKLVAILPSSLPPPPSQA